MVRRVAQELEEGMHHLQGQRALLSKPGKWYWT